SGPRRSATNTPGAAATTPCYVATGQNSCCSGWRRPNRPRTACTWTSTSTLATWSPRSPDWSTWAPPRFRTGGWPSTGASGSSWPTGKATSSACAAPAPAAADARGSLQYSPGMAGNDVDVVIIGSGFGGSTAALRLTEKGYRVAVLEAGRRFDETTLPKTSW